MTHRRKGRSPGEGSSSCSTACWRRWGWARSPRRPGLLLAIEARGDPDRACRRRTRRRTQGRQLAHDQLWTLPGAGAQHARRHAGVHRGLHPLRLPGEVRRRRRTSSPARAMPATSAPMTARWSRARLPRRSSRSPTSSRTTRSSSGVKRDHSGGRPALDPLLPRAARRGRVPAASSCCTPSSRTVF